MNRPLTERSTFGPKHPQKLKNPLATFLAKMLQHSREVSPRRPASKFNLYDPKGGRKYLNAAERRRFQTATQTCSLEIRTFCLVLMWSGCRVSEALALTPLSIDLETKTVSIVSLKKRRSGAVRQVPLPSQVLAELERVFDLARRQRDLSRCDKPIWKFTRNTAWRHVKRIMKSAGISGTMATPKGLRHGFGVAAFETVPPHLVQRWLGHASLRTTAIYGEVSGAEERMYAERIWRRW